MWRSRKFIIGLVATIVLVSACIGGVAIAQDNEEESQTETTIDTLWDKVVTILQNDGVNVTSDQLKSAFKDAREQLRNAALENRLEELVTEGKITQEQADEYLKWINDKPDIADSFGFGFNGRGGFRGILRMHGWGGLCAPVE